ncbi:MAG TPA: cupin domain-containing protein [Myxococcales bacterium]|jgi:quercetin dioxygenase-like cupin family protein
MGIEAGSTEVQEPLLVSQEQILWAPAPDAFAKGVQCCVLHGDLASPGRVFTLRLKTAQGFLFAPHSHPHDEHLTIVSGALLMGDGRSADRKASRLMRAGSYVFLPMNQFHFAWAMEEDTVLQIHAVGPFGIIYAHPEDDPRIPHVH